MKKQILIAATLMLMMSGCSQPVTPQEYEWSVKVCANNEGLDVAKFSWAFYPRAVCKNGATFQSKAKDFK